MSYKLSSTLLGHEQDVKDVATTEYGGLVSVLRDGTTRIWSDIYTTHSEATIVFHSPTNSFINSVACINGLIASGGQDTMIYLSDEHGEDKYQLIGHEGNVCSMSYSHCQLISSSWDCTAIVWNLKEFVPKYILSGHESSVWDCQVLGEDQYLTCSADKTIRLWHGKSEVKQFVDHLDVIRKLLILEGGEQFLSCSNDGTIKLWDLQTGKNLQTFYGHESFVYDLALIANGKFVSTGEDRTVRIWDLATGNVLQVITLPCISVWCVTALPNGDFAVGGSDNLVRVFTAHPEKVAPEEELLKFKEAVQSSSIAEQSLDDLKKTDIPGYEALSQPGKQEGSTIMVKNPDNGTIEAHQWSGGEWHKIGDVVGSSSSGKKQTYQGKEYDFVFDVDIKDGEPPLKLPYNVNDNPYTVAEKFLSDNDLPASYTDEVVRFLQKNTEGASLQESTNDSNNPSAGRVIDPYSDAYNKQQGNSALKVIPSKSYIYFTDYKRELLVNGLKKLNLSQDSELQLSDQDFLAVESSLLELNSKQALELITKYCSHIIRKWTASAKLIGFDLLRVSIPKVTTVDILTSTDAAEIILDVVNLGLENINVENPALLMMILKVLNNLVGTTLFVQLYIDPCGTDNKLYEYNTFFQNLLKKLQNSTAKLTQLAKLYTSTMTALTTLVYNLSAYQLQTSALKNNMGSAKPVIEFMDNLGNQIVASSSEAAYRLAVAYGNFKYGKLYTNETPSWLAEAGTLYAINGEQRFLDIAEDLKNI